MSTKNGKEGKKTHVCGELNGVMGKGAFEKQGDKYRCVECGKAYDKLPKGYMEALKKLNPKKTARLEKGTKHKTETEEEDEEPVDDEDEEEEANTRQVIIPLTRTANYLTARELVRDKGGLPSNVLHDDILVYSKKKFEDSMYWTAWTREILVYPKAGGKFEKGKDVVDSSRDGFLTRQWVFPASCIPEVAIGKEKVGLFVDPQRIEVKGGRVEILADLKSVIVLSPFIQTSGQVGLVDERTRVPLEADYDILEKVSEEQKRMLLRIPGPGVRPIVRSTTSEDRMTISADHRQADLLCLGWVSVKRVEREENPHYDKAFLKASFEGDAIMVKNFLKRGADVNMRSARGNITPLLAAADGGHKNIVEILIANGSEVNAKDEEGETAMMHAVRKGHKETFEMLIAKGADVNLKNNKEFTAMMLAAAAGHKDFVETLIAKGGDVNAEGAEGVTALMVAKLNKHEDIAKMLEAAGARKEDYSKMQSKISSEVDKKMLLDESYNGHITEVKWVLERGVDVNTRDKNAKECTPMMLAALKGHVDIVKMLIAKGADMEARNETGLTALMYAASNGHKDVVETLISNKADVDAKDNGRATALMYAAGKGYTDIVHLLIENGGDVNARDAMGGTAIAWALHYGHSDVIKTLRRAGAMQ